MTQHPSVTKVTLVGESCDPVTHTHVPTSGLSGRGRGQGLESLHNKGRILHGKLVAVYTEKVSVCILIRTELHFYSYR